MLMGLPLQTPESSYIGAQGNMYKNVHSIIIRDGEKLEITYKSVGEWEINYSIFIQ